jgi:hypothetical protein
MVDVKKGGVPKWLRERSAKPRCSGSNPLAASIFRLVAYALLPDALQSADPSSKSQARRTRGLRAVFFDRGNPSPIFHPIPLSGDLLRNLHRRGSCSHRWRISCLRRALELSRLSAPCDRSCNHWRQLFLLAGAKSKDWFAAPLGG